MKKLYLVLGIIIALLFSGCGETADGARTNEYVSETFNGGQDALTIEFTEGQPPESVRDGGLNPFNIRVLVKNEGETDIEENSAHLALSGINPSDFGLTDSSTEIPALRGVKIQGTNVIDGGVQPVMFSQLRYIPSLPGPSTQKLSVDVCYPYETRALIRGCVSGETFRSSTDDLEICDLEGNLEFSNSGAPVQIENVKQQPVGQSSIQVQFDIVDKSLSQNGRIFRENSFDSDCKIQGKSVSGTDASLSKNYVSYTFDSKGLPVNCDQGQSVGEAFLSNGKATVYCTVDTTGQEDYETGFGVTLNYDYFDRIDTSILIEHIQTN